jgi:AcrR family transcriptional regulator
MRKPSKVVRKSTRKAEQRKDQIIGIARRCLAEHGLHGVRTSHIRDAAGVSNGNLFYHFRNKAEILEAVVSDSVEKATRHTAEFLASHSEPIAALTELSMLADIMRAGWDMPAGLRLEIMAESDRNPKLKKLLHQQSATLLQQIENTLAAAESKGKIRRGIDRAELARLIQLIWNGTAMSRNTVPNFDIKYHEGVLAHFIQAWLGGEGRRSRPKAALAGSRSKRAR